MSKEKARRSGPGSRAPRLVRFAPPMTILRIHHLTPKLRKMWLELWK